MSPTASFRTGEKHRSSSDFSSDSKKQKTDDKELTSTRYVSKDAQINPARGTEEYYQIYCEETSDDELNQKFLVLVSRGRAKCFCKGWPRNLA